MIPQISQRLFNALPDAYALIRPAQDTFLIENSNEAYGKLLNVDNIPSGTPLFELLTPHLEELSNSELKQHRSLLNSTIREKQKQESDILKFNSSKRGKPEKSHLRFIYIPLLDDESEVAWILQKVEELNGQFTSDEKQPGSKQELHILNENLQKQINYKIAQYEAASRELNDFIYSVSHDLRAPLRRIDGFSQELINEYLDRLDETGAHYLKRVRQGAQDMGNLIDDLLKLSRISRRKVERTTVDIGKLAKSVCDELLEVETDREIEVRIEEGLTAEADKGLLKVMLTNLLSNAIKFTGREEKAVIEVGKTETGGTEYFFIKDNGIGFDPAYSDKLFKAFDRLHSQKEFPGTGIGLATVKRIVSLHGGDIRAESRAGEGAAFYFNFKQS